MVASVLCQLGHIATSRQLAEHGLTPARLRRGIGLGHISRIRRGIYACAHANAHLARAASVGGSVTCVSVLRAAGVWAGHSLGLHVQVAPDSHLAGDRSAAPGLSLAPLVAETHAGNSTDRTLRDGGERIDLSLPLRYHWVLPRFEMKSKWLASPLQSLWQAMHCLDEENAIAAMESAIHEEFLSVDQVMRLAVLAPRRLSDGIERMIPDSGSGQETIVRLRLERAGFRVEAQNFVPGTGRQDLLVEGCVGLDIDGRRWHGDDRFAFDRDRDVHVEGLGRRAIRLRYSHIFDTWPHTLAVIERAVTDARREQSRRHGRVIITYSDPL